MSRIIAIDYGGKRVGIAVTDTLQMIANPLTTLSPDQLISFLKEYTGKEEVEEIVVGLPKDLFNNDTHATAMVEGLVKTLRETFESLRIITVDERYTSKIAKAAISISGLSKKKRKDKNLIDKTSASLILQTYLETKR
ncbi:MAG: Holliday junction resolvase RuvX [Cyclobacteriaceae bacterium]|nr:Holliday junction resolvase RuvX [Cyclobacteriaceae bacterium]